MSNQNDQYNDTFQLGYKCSLLLLLILIVCIFIDKNIQLYIKIVLIVLLYFLLLADKCYDNGESSECFGRDHDRIYDLNKDRGRLGNFYVNCHQCVRDRLLEEEKQSREKCEQCDGANYCLANCTQETEKTMSFYNKKYIDNDMIYCYNCPLDKNTQLFLRNYDNFPYINGPPQTNRFTF